MLLEKIKPFRLILATQSPRRHFLMREAGFAFDVVLPEGIEEVFPPEMPEAEVPLYLAKLKASWFIGRLAQNEIVITADTIVAIDGRVLGKPENYGHAFEMIKTLSGRTHDVVTGVCFTGYDKSFTFSAISKVSFRHFSDEEIKYYIETYRPYDKAGSYGAQEWIGYVGIEHIEGSYFNVMGLPIQKLYVELEKFID